MKSQTVSFYLLNKLSLHQNLLIHHMVQYKFQPYYLLQLLVQENRFNRLYLVQNNYSLNYIQFLLFHLLQWIRIFKLRMVQNIVELNEKLQEWSIVYNTIRPHSAIKCKSPNELELSKADESELIENKCLMKRQK